LAGEADHDHVRPPVAVEVAGEDGESIAVAVGAVAAVADGSNAVQLPGRGLIPEVADRDVGLAVAVEGGDCDPLRTELRVNLRLLPGDRLTRPSQRPAAGGFRKLRGPGRAAPGGNAIGAYIG